MGRLTSIATPLPTSRAVRSSWILVTCGSMRSPTRIVLSMVFAALGATVPLSAAEPTADARFEALARGYIEKLLSLRPELATRLGDHRFDSRLDDRTPEGNKRGRALSEETLKALTAIRVGDLGRTNSVDYRILKSRLEYDLFRHDELREREWNPLQYHTANSIYELLACDFAPLDTRLRNAASRLWQIPAVVRAAKANLKRPTRVFT